MGKRQLSAAEIKDNTVKKLAAVNWDVSKLDGADIDLFTYLLTDDRAFIEEFLLIQDKLGQLSLLKLNHVQKKVEREIARQRGMGVPIRVITLKARQLGITTYFAARFFKEAATTKNCKCGIIAHKADASTKILEKMKLFYENLPPLLQPMKKNSNAKELIFENPTTSAREKIQNPGLRSQIYIETAVNKDAFRSFTLQRLHVSEIAFWPYPQETMTSALQAVPQAPNTIVAVESTANGIGNYFHEMWQAAERGESEFVPMFFPWFDDPTYSLNVADDFEVTDEEKELASEFELTKGQLAWRRWCIRANCNGDLNKFHQEYPATPNEAFIASGRPVFDAVVCERHLRVCTDAPFVGRVVEKNGAPTFMTGYGGYLSIWEKPRDGRDYVIGIDTAQGLESGDFSVMSVWEKHDRKMVAEWHGHIDADLLGKEAAILGRFYNYAWLIPEVNNTGIATVAALRRERYGRIYRRRTTAEALTDAPKDTYGWYTSGKTKPLLIDNMIAFVRDNVGKIPNRLLIKECLSYVYDAAGHTNAQSGCHDDRVMAAAMALYVMKDNSLRQEPHSYGDPEQVLSTYYGGLNSTTGY